MRPVNNSEWLNEFTTLRWKLQYARQEESAMKRELKSLQALLAESKRETNRLTKERLSLERAVNTFWQKKRQKIYASRRWTRQNTGRALDRISEMKSRT